MFPSLYVPHGGGPCFFMEDSQGIWAGMASFLAALPASLPERPQAILIVSGHWETPGFALTGALQPPLVYDYCGFPPHTYQLRYDAPGAPLLAERVAGLLQRAGFAAQVDPARGLDHGVFVPLKVAFPDATVPVVELSLDAGLDAALHLAAGRALAPLRADAFLGLLEEPAKDDAGRRFRRQRDPVGRPGKGSPAFAAQLQRRKSGLNLCHAGHQLIDRDRVLMIGVVFSPRQPDVAAIVRLAHSVGMIHSADGRDVRPMPFQGLQRL
jgi:hypothetical protein